MEWRRHSVPHLPTILYHNLDRAPRLRGGRTVAYWFPMRFSLLKSPNSIHKFWRVGARTAYLFGVVALLMPVSSQLRAQAPGMPRDTMRPATGSGSNMQMQVNSPPLGLSMQRSGSGTSWQPDATSMRASHSMLGGWDLMMHGVAYLQFDDQGSNRGDKQVGSVNWGMIEAGRSVSGGMLNLRGMVSAEPFTVGSRGYPLLLQSGEAYHGAPLHDRQHPHDLFMEIAAIYDHPVGNDLSVSLYLAPVGEPAIGPVAFPHRQSAASDPLAPLGHHWQDATHVSFGVITAGMYTRMVKVEGSIFNGREPDEIRTNFDYKGRRLDSYAGRLTVNPNANWSLSGSYAYLNSPEQLDPERSVHRGVASVMYVRPFGISGSWASTVIYGGNKHAGQRGFSNSALAESNLELDNSNTVFGRIEFVQKSAEDLAVPLASPQFSGAVTTEFRVGEVTLGYVRELSRVYGGSLGAGVAGSLNVVPSTLQFVYGSRTPLGGTIFLRLRPGLMNTGMHMTEKHAMPMTNMHDVSDVRGGTR